MHINTVNRIRKRFVLEGERPALSAKPARHPPCADHRRPSRGHLIAICTGPRGGPRLLDEELLADELVRREVVTPTSGETVRRALKKTR